jgi:CheY-like chemotaxis protein
MQTITLIDEDPNIHQSILPALMDRFPDYVIHSCVDGAVGWEMIQSHAPELVIFDLSLPSLDGLDLFLRIKTSAPRTAVILTSTNRLVLQDLKKNFSGEMRLHTMAKPLTAEQIVQDAVIALFGPQISSLRDVSLTSVLQLLALEGKDCWLDVSDLRARGTCRFLRGEIVHARCGEHQGIEAVQAMMRFSAPVCSVFADPGHQPLQRNVFARFNELLLLCCSAFDEEMQVA